MRLLLLLLIALFTVSSASCQPVRSLCRPTQVTYLVNDVSWTFGTSAMWVSADNGTLPDTQFPPCERSTRTRTESFTVRKLSPASDLVLFVYEGRSVPIKPDSIHGQFAGTRMVGGRSYEVRRSTWSENYFAQTRSDRGIYPSHIFCKLGKRRNAEGHQCRLHYEDHQNDIEAHVSWLSDQSAELDAAVNTVSAFILSARS